MKRVMVLAVLAITSIAKADLYSDRASVYQQRERIAAERERQQNINERLSFATKRSAQFEMLLRGFIRSRGGLSSDGTCTLSVLDSRQSVYSTWIDQQISLSQLGSIAGALGPCSVNLKDGLACTVFWALETNADVLDADCYDANSYHKTFRYGGRVAKASVPKKHRAR